jgi:hypothetical protein
MFFLLKKGWDLGGGSYKEQFTVSTSKESPPETGDYFFGNQPLKLQATDTGIDGAMNGAPTRFIDCVCRGAIHHLCLSVVASYGKIPSSI